MVRVAVHLMILLSTTTFMAVSSSAVLAAPQDASLTVEDVTVLLDGGFDEASIISDQLLERGMVAVRLDDQKIRQLKAAGATDLLIANVAYQVGEAFLKDSGDYEEALLHYELSAKNAPNSLLPLFGIIQVYKSQGNYPKTLEVCQRAVKVAPENPEPIMARCRAFMDLGEYQRAISDAIAATKLASELFEAHRLVALLCAAAPADDVRDGKTAVVAAARAIELAEGNSAANQAMLRLTLAAALAESGDFEGAVKAQTEAVELASEAFKPFAMTLLEQFKQGIPFRLEAPSGSTNSAGNQRPTKPADEQPSDDRPVNFIQYLQKSMVEIAGGSFQMGSTKFSEADDERPVQTIEVKPFYISHAEVTNRVYMFVMTGEPDVPNPDHPVESVSWSDCQEFLTRLNELCGADVFRLPTEAEWEYAARAGTQTEYYFGDDPAEIESHAWYKKNSGSQSHPVGQLAPNAWKLTDMYGNVGEWCQDAYGFYGAPAPPENPRALRVFRGGSWANTDQYCRSAARSVGQPNVRLKGVGFRLAMDAAASQHLTSTLQEVKKETKQEEPREITLQQAIEQVERSHQADQNNPQISFQLASLIKQRAFVNYEEKKYNEAAADVERALGLLSRHSPGDGVSVDCYILLSWIRATAPLDSVRNSEQAIKMSGIVCGLTNWQKWIPISCLAAAYGEAGQFDRAIKRQVDAISKAPQESHEELNRRLESYRAGKPLRITGGF